MSPGGVSTRGVTAPGTTGPDAPAMRTLGLIGGMSWESTATYYRLINQHTRAALGGLHSAPILLHSVDFAPIEAMQRAQDWQRAADTLVTIARNLEHHGAELILLCTNTMHIVADTLEAELDVPFLHLADATARALRRAGHTHVGLLGTRFTMEQPFYRDRLARHGLSVRVPDAPDREAIDDAIYAELCRGQVHDATRQRFLAIIDHLRTAGAEAVVLGCTEIGLLVQPSDTDVPLFDTTAIHAAEAVRAALG